VAIAARCANEPDGSFLALYFALRHSHATHFLEGGGAVSDLQAQRGHANLATTQRYAAVINERRRATVLGMDFRPRQSRRASAAS
jgi:site-specific recombinase XerD